MNEKEQAFQQCTGNTMDLDIRVVGRVWEREAIFYRKCVLKNK